MTTKEISRSIRRGKPLANRNHQDSRTQRLRFNVSLWLGACTRRNEEGFEDP